MFFSEKPFLVKLINTLVLYIIRKYQFSLKNIYRKLLSNGFVSKDKWQEESGFSMLRHLINIPVTLYKDLSQRGYLLDCHFNKTSKI